jgi:hypothetical protein
MGVISLKDQVVDLLLEELSDCVALSDYCITFIDLILPMKDGLISCCDNFILLCDQGLKFHYLINLSISIPVVTLSYTSQLTHAVAQQDLIMVLNIDKPDGITNRFLG